MMSEGSLMPYIHEEAFESVNVYGDVYEITVPETITSEIVGVGTRIVTRKWNPDRRRNDYFVTVKRVRYTVYPDFAHTLDMLRNRGAYENIFFRGLVVNAWNRDGVMVANANVWAHNARDRFGIVRFEGAPNDIVLPHTSIRRPEHSEWRNLDPNTDWNV